MPVWPKPLPVYQQRSPPPCVTTADYERWWSSKLPAAPTPRSPSVPEAVQVQFRPSPLTRLRTRYAVPKVLTTSSSRRRGAAHTSQKGDQLHPDGVGGPLYEALAAADTDHADAYLTLVHGTSPCAVRVADTASSAHIDAVDRDRDTATPAASPSLRIVGGAIVRIGVACLAAAALTAFDVELGSGFDPRPGAAGVGDPLYPGLGNGGYDVAHYTIELDVDVDANLVAGSARIDAVATQDLSSFNLDLRGLEVREVRVNGRPAGHAREGFELTITPAAPVRAETTFTAAVAYEGRPSHEAVRPKRLLRVAGCATTRGSSRSVSRGGRPTGTRSTNIRPTRPRTRSSSPFPIPTRLSRVASWSRRSITEKPPPTSGRAATRWPAI